MAVSSLAPGATVTFSGRLPPNAERTLPVTEHRAPKIAIRSVPTAASLRAVEKAVAETRRPLPPRAPFIMYVKKLPKSYHNWSVAGMIFPYREGKIFGGEGAKADFWMERG